MKWSILLAVVSIGLVAGDGAWKENYEYKYELVAKRVLKQADDDSEVVTFGVTILPQSDNVLNGKIHSVSYCKYSTANCDSDDMLLNKPFKAYLKNGVIDTLSVDQRLTKDHIKSVKFILSQFQIDTKARNAIRVSDNQNRRDQSANDYYTIMEPTLVGVCKTTYDISRLPEYLLLAKYYTMPSLSQYSSEQEVIEIAKKTDVNDCGNDKTDLSADVDDQNKGLIDTRVVISGSRDNYTIHTSVGIMKNDHLNEFAYLKLKSMARINENSYLARSSSYNVSPRFVSMKSVGNLVYNMDERFSERYSERY